MTRPHGCSRGNLDLVREFGPSLRDHTALCRGYREPRSLIARCS
jgi:hypothetical protein